MIIKHVRNHGNIIIKPKNDIERNIVSSQRFLEFSNQLFLKNKFNNIDNAMLYGIKDDITRYLLDEWNYSGNMEVIIE